MTSNSEKTQAVFDAEAWVIARRNLRTGQVQFAQRDTNHNWWGSDISGNFTIKYTSSKSALEKMSQWRTQSMQTVYRFSLMKFADAQKMAPTTDEKKDSYDNQNKHDGVGIEEDTSKTGSKPYNPKQFKS